jgi:hypothetical protein
MTLFLGVLFALLALIAPLGNLLLAKVHLENAAGEAARYASQDVSSVATGPLSGDKACADAKTAYGDATGNWRCAATVADMTAGADPVCTDDVLPGDRRAGSGICIHLHDSVDLGLFGSILSVAGLGSGGTVPIAASAVQRQE